MYTAVVIDDEDTIRHLLKLYLRKLNFRVHEANDGASGLGVCIFQRPDLIVTDISMPQYDGFQLIKLLKQHEALKAAKIVVTSGVDFMTGDIAKKEGADAFLQKPFKREEFLKILEQLELTHERDD